MRRSSWLLVVLVVLLLTWGGVMLSQRAKVRAALRAAAERYALDPDWPDAIGYTETGGTYRMTSTNMSGPDGARGGAWGPTQITETTARAAGYTGPMEAFTQDEQLAAEWTARILAAGSPRDFAEAVAVWNAGRYRADRNGNGILDPGEAPALTVGTYWPRALAALATVQSDAFNGRALA